MKIVRFYLTTLVHLQYFVTEDSNEALKLLTCDCSVRDCALSSAQYIVDHPNIFHQLAVKDDLIDDEMVQSCVRISWAMATERYEMFGADPAALHNFFEGISSIEQSNRFMVDLCKLALEVATIILIMSPVKLANFLSNDWKWFFVDLILLCPETSIRELMLEESNLIFVKSFQSVDVISEMIVFLWSCLKNYCVRFCKQSYQYFVLFGNIILLASKFESLSLAHVQLYELSILFSFKVNDFVLKFFLTPFSAELY